VLNGKRQNEMSRATWCQLENSKSKNRADVPEIRLLSGQTSPGVRAVSADGGSRSA
jgi:hypothetical protein